MEKTSAELSAATGLSAMQLKRSLAALRGSSRVNIVVLRHSLGSYGGKWSNRRKIFVTEEQ